MSQQRHILLVVLPGSGTLSFNLSRLLPSVVFAVLLVPFVAGVSARRYAGAGADPNPVLADSLRTVLDVSASMVRALEPRELRLARAERTRPATAAAAMPARRSWPAAGVELVPRRAASEIMLTSSIAPVLPRRPSPLSPGPLGVLGGLAKPKPVSSAASPESASPRTTLVSARAVKRAFARREVLGLDLERAAELARGELRLQAMHVSESVRVRPFDDDGRPHAEAFASLRHLMRCRTTGHEVAIDPRLVRILTQISAAYDKPVQLISGHRAPHVNGTSPSSQHTLGRAADIRVPGASLTELRKLAILLGARGVGLYPEKGFVHIDVRDKPRYFWIYSKDEGEEEYPEPAHARAAFGPLGAGLRGRL